MIPSVVAAEVAGPLGDALGDRFGPSTPPPRARAHRRRPPGRATSPRGRTSPSRCRSSPRTRAAGVAPRRWRPRHAVWCLADRSPAGRRHPLAEGGAGDDARRDVQEAVRVPPHGRRPAARLRGWAAGGRHRLLDAGEGVGRVRQRRAAQAARRRRVAGRPGRRRLAVPDGADRVPVAGRALDGPAHPHLHRPAVRGAGAEREGGAGRTPAARAAGGAVQRRAAVAGGPGDAGVDRGRGAGLGTVSAGGGCGTT